MANRADTRGKSRSLRPDDGRMSYPWFRMYKEFATDPVVQSLAFEDQRHFVILLCMKCDGILDRPLKGANRDRIIYRGLGLDPHAAEEAKIRLQEVNLIDKKWNPKAWDKRQFLSDHSTERSRKSRKNKETRNGIATDKNSCSNAPDTDTDTDKKNKQKKVVKKRASEMPLSFELSKAMRAYAESKGVSEIDDVFEGFCSYHRAKGSTFVDWSAAWQTWVRNHLKFQKSDAPSNVAMLEGLR